VHLRPAHRGGSRVRLLLRFVGLVGPKEDEGEGEGERKRTLDHGGEEPDGSEDLVEQPRQHHGLMTHGVERGGRVPDALGPTQSCLRTARSAGISAAPGSERGTGRAERGPRTLPTKRCTRCGQENGPHPFRAATFHSLRPRAAPLSDASMLAALSMV
jgi:hypothetical protein